MYRYASGQQVPDCRSVETQPTSLDFLSLLASCIRVLARGLAVVILVRLRYSDSSGVRSQNRGIGYYWFSAPDLWSWPISFSGRVCRNRRATESVPDFRKKIIR